ncbi:MAG: hypothetical protein HY820_15250 [Acidobacteria bacterium]|nr:hypothetical protein [Acidobacteriota bacterium]
MLRCLLAFLGIFLPCCASAQQDTLILFLDSPTSQPANVLSRMKEETSALLRTAGHVIEFRDLKSRKSGESFDQVVVVRWNGACDAGQTPGTIRNKEKLAFAHVSDGRVLPFVEVECRAVTALLADLARLENVWQRNQLMGRAVGRLVAHEVFHVLTQRTTHDHTGVGKPHFQKRDLIAESFTFEEQTRAQMQKPAPASSEESSEEGTGR